MALAQLFRSPFVRVPFLAFAVLSSVATSSPNGWVLHARATTPAVTVVKGAPIERRFAYSASQEFELRLDIRALSSRGQLKVTVPECGIDADLSLEISDTVSTTCDKRDGTFTVRFETPDAAPLTLALDVAVAISGDESNEAPDGAHVSVKAEP